MPTVRSICTDALMEIGAYGQGETLDAADAQLALLRFRNQLDAWQADRLTLSVQSQTAFVWPDRNAVSAAVGAGGTGYSVNDVLTLVGGTTSGAATFRVSTVAVGVVTAVVLVSAGHYSALPVSPTTTTVAPAGGTGATLAVTFTAAQTSTQTIGPGGNINIQRPVWINTIKYVIPGSSPAVESPMGPLDADSYATLSIKGLQSGLPTLYYYQTSIDTVLGSLFIWPQPTQLITLNLYAPQAVGVPTTLDDILLGPPGYQEAFMYQLALRLCTPFSKQVPPLLPQMAAQAYLLMKRPNNQPGLLGVDQALVPTNGSGYNILSDQTTSSGSR